MIEYDKEVDFMLAKYCKQIKDILLCLLLAFGGLLIVSKCSLLYPLQDWVDTNCFFTMGRGMFHGLVPYQDLFEQKGPLLYFYHLIAVAISETSFLGVFILEVLSYTLFLYYLKKILAYFITDHSKCVILTMLAVLFTLTMRSFHFGDSAEEFCLPFITIQFYHLIKLVKTKKLRKKELFVDGFLAGCTFMIKYTLLGFFIGYGITLTITYFMKKEKKEILSAYLYLFLGGILAICPWLIYFIITKGLKDFIHVYFVLNITKYSSPFGGLFKKIYHIISTCFYNLTKHPLYALITLPGIINFFIKRKSDFLKLDEKCLLFIPLLTTITFVYIGKSFKYYFFILALFIVFGLLFLNQYLLKKKSYSKLVIITCFISLFPLIFLLSKNTKDMFYPKDYYAQVVFANKIKESGVDNPTLLNYGFLDGGFYFTTNTLPNTYYFQQNNFDYEIFPDNKDAQDNYVKSSRCDFIILRLKDETFTYLDPLFKNYQVIAIHEQKTENFQATYILLEHKKHLS